MPRIRVISTGGTIASRYDAKAGGAVTTLTGHDLVAAVPGVERFADLDVEEFTRVPSQYLTPQQAMDLGHRCQQLMAEGHADGVVVTMGTNALAEYAYLMALTAQPPGPLVVTGAMRNPSLLSPDGPRNLYDSVITAASQEARGRGVMVCVNGEVHEPRDVVKTHTMNVATFQSWELGPIGVVRNDRVVFYRTPTIKEHIPAQRVDARVEVITALEGDDGGLLQAAVDIGARGIVLVGMGGGHVPATMVPAIQYALGQGIPLVIVSRAFGGLLLEGGYGYEGGDVHLRRLGVIPGGSLSGPKARLKLMAVLDITQDPAQVRQYFDNV